MVVKLDLHVHTLSRGVVFIDAPGLKRAIMARGLDGVAVTNFFDIEHALWLQAKLPEHKIIVGQEVWTSDGHVIGLGITRRVRDLQPARKTVEEIHAQGGVAVAVHPFMMHGLGDKAIEAGVDAIEVYNGLLGRLMIFNMRADFWAKQHRLPRLSSGDTSSAKYVGWNQTHVKVDSPQGILEAICQGKTSLVRRALPLPWIFAAKNILGFSHVKPWPVHAAPCLVCGEAWIVRLQQQERACMACGVVERSHLACCRGHYYCVPCLVAIGHRRALELRQQEYLSS
ncbi:MAG: hypothetical protein V2A70_01455 [Candidatus Omnitrophota bacterium]